MIVRIAAVQYLLRQIDDWSGFENQVRFIMKAAGDYKPQFVVLPEIFTTQLLSFMDTSDIHSAVRQMHEYTPRYLDLMREQARKRREANPQKAREQVRKWYRKQANQESADQFFVMSNAASELKQAIENETNEHNDTKQ